MIHHESCPLCFSKDLTPWLTCRDYLVSNKLFELVKCGECGLIMTQDPPEADQLASFYETDGYISHNAAAGGFLSSVYRMIREIMLVRKRKFIVRATGLNHGSLLDIGCGTGHFANSMKTAGWDVTGVEPNDKARLHAASQFGLNVLFPGQINELADKSFDCITMWHVMEHFNDPFRYISGISELLKPGGLCLVALPNCYSADAKYYGEFWAAYDVPRHLWHFSPDTLARFAEKTGFSVVTSGMLPFDVFYISILSERYRGASIPFLKGTVRGAWFGFRALFNKSGSSSLFYFLKFK